MMSPDPPREDSNRDGEGNQDLSFNQVGFDDEDDGVIFVHDGPYELDISSQEDSEFGSDNDENDAPRINDDGVSLPHRTRAYYQLLIPFPAAESSSENNDDSLPTEDNPAVATSSNSTNEVTQGDDKLDTSSNNIGSDKNESPPKEVPVEKREIQLSQDKVDTIKNVMKGFALPPASIPPWAKEVDEDTWKKRLFDSIDNKK